MSEEVNNPLEDNHSIELISADLKNIIINAFDVCFLLLEGATQGDLRADQFLDKNSVDE